MNNGQIFVVGMNGSGTIVFADALGRHPEYVCSFSGLTFHPAVLILDAIHGWCRVPGSPRADGSEQQVARYFNSKQINELEQIAGKLLANLGYEVKLRRDKDLSSYT